MQLKGKMAKKMAMYPTHSDRTGQSIVPEEILLITAAINRPRSPKKNTAATKIAEMMIPKNMPIDQLVIKSD